MTSKAISLVSDAPTIYVARKFVHVVAIGGNSHSVVLCNDSVSCTTPYRMVRWIFYSFFLKCLFLILIFQIFSSSWEYIYLIPHSAVLQTFLTSRAKHPRFNHKKKKKSAQKMLSAEVEAVFPHISFNISFIFDLLYCKHATKWIHMTKVSCPLAR